MSKHTIAEKPESLINNNHKAKNSDQMAENELIRNHKAEFYHKTKILHRLTRRC